MCEDREANKQLDKWGRYWVFARHSYDTGGGMHDFVFSVDELPPLYLLEDRLIQHFNDMWTVHDTLAVFDSVEKRHMHWDDDRREWV